MPGRVWWKEGRKKGKRNERGPAIHIRMTGQYAGYPARMLVFAWEGRKKKRKNKKDE